MRLASLMIRLKMWTKTPNLATSPRMQIQTPRLACLVEMQRARKRKRKTSLHVNQRWLIPINVASVLVSVIGVTNVHIATLLGERELRKFVETS